MILICKKGKDKTKVDSYRPISLTSRVGKPVERLINSRLIWYLEKEGVTSDNQAGCRQHRSTEDQVTYIAQETDNALQGKKYTIVVWADLEKAFDKGLKNCLNTQLHQYGKYGIKDHTYKLDQLIPHQQKSRVKNKRHFSRKET